jgi:cell division septal protein FtsQ
MVINRHRRMDYQKKNFKNPYFPAARRAYRKKPRVFGKWLLVFLLFVLIGGLVYLNQTEKYKIKNIKISGQQYISQEEIEQVVINQTKKRRFLLFRQSNLFFFSSQSLKNQLADYFLLTETKISKNYPDTIRIELNEKKSFIVWVSNQAKYLIDENGIAFKKITTENTEIQAIGQNTDLIRPAGDLTNQPVIYDLTGAGVSLGQAVISTAIVQFIKDLKEGMENDFDFDIASFNYTVQNKELNLKTTQNWEVRFNLENSVKDQLSLLANVLSEKIKDRKSLKYIDLRYSGKVFYQ